MSLYKIKHLLNYISQWKDLTNACIEIPYQQNDEITKINEEYEVKLLPFAIEHLLKNNIINKTDFINIINEFKIVAFEINFQQPSFHNIYNRLCTFIENDMKTKNEFILSVSYSVTSIEACAFDKCSLLTQIIIPSSVKSIGYSAFRECSSLKQVEILFSVIIIEDFAFRDCKSLIQITIPSSVTSIGNCTFLGCSSLIQISIPSSVISIGNSAFSRCSSLKQIKIPSSLKSIDQIGLNSQVKI